MDKKQIILIREQLGSINLSDIENLKDKRLTQEELDARAIDTEIFYKNHFEKIIKLFIQTQLEKIAEEADTEDKLNYCRGTVNGLYIIEEWFKQQKKISLSRFDTQEGAVEV